MIAITVFYLFDRGGSMEPRLFEGVQGSENLVNTAGFIRNIVSRGQASLSSSQAAQALPTRLAIPNINLNAMLEHVGVTQSGVLDAPKVPTMAAWFDRGPRPGEKGNAIIIGHFGWKNGIPAVFDGLYKLHEGDRIYVIDENNATTTFVVRELRTYRENDDASEVFRSRDGNAHLNLITCSGVWNKARKSYSNRLVVFADKVME